MSRSYFCPFWVTARPAAEQGEAGDDRRLGGLCAASSLGSRAPARRAGAGQDQPCHRPGSGCQRLQTRQAQAVAGNAEVISAPVRLNPKEQARLPAGECWLSSSAGMSRGGQMRGESAKKKERCPQKPERRQHLKDRRAHVCDA